MKKNAFITEIFYTIISFFVVVPIFLFSAIFSFNTLNEYSGTKCENKTFILKEKHRICQENFYKGRGKSLIEKHFEFDLFDMNTGVSSCSYVHTFDEGTEFTFKKFYIQKSYFNSFGSDHGFYVIETKGHKNIVVKDYDIDYKNCTIDHTSTLKTALALQKEISANYPNKIIDTNSKLVKFYESLKKR